MNHRIKAFVYYSKVVENTQCKIEIPGYPDIKCHQLSFVKDGSLEYKKAEWRKMDYWIHKGVTFPYFHRGVGFSNISDMNNNRDYTGIDPVLVSFLAYREIKKHIEGI